MPVSGSARIGFNHTDLNGWSINIVGGTDAGKGSVRPGSALLEEGDSFLVGIEQSFVVPVNPAPVVFTYTDLNFDTSDPDSINDAFEASLVGPDGKPLVYGYNTGRDSFFNATESVGVALAPDVTETGDVIKTVTVSVSNLLPGTQATLRFRLVNNDQDTLTKVRILDVEVPSDNHTPDLASIPDQLALEGNALTVAATFSDPDSGDTHTATVTWGDGNTSDATVTPQVGGGDVSATHTYADDGTYSASMTVVDSKGASSTRSFEVVVSNVAPTLTIGGAATVAEATQYTLSLSSSDPGADTIDHWTINWGDGQTQDVPGNPASLLHTYPDGGNSYTIFATATDEDGTFAAADTVTVQVLNVDPTLSISGAASVNEGSTYTLSLSSSDPGADTIDHWTVTWGDGNVETVSGNPSSVSHAFADGNNSYTISATATDEDGTFAAGNTVAVQVNNVAPTLNISGASSVNEGSSYTLSLLASDPGADTIDHWTINWGDGHVQIVSGDSSTVSHTYSDGPNSYTISASTTDEDGTYSAGNTVAVQVDNVPPTLTISGAASIPEGSLYTLSLASSDPGADTINHWTITWGDGNVQPVVGNPPSIDHVYADGPANYTISATATDEDGTFDSNHLPVSVANIAPTVTAKDAFVRFKTAVTLEVGKFTDPGFTSGTTHETFTATINWGDGTATSAGTVSVAPGSGGVLTLGSVTGTHTFASAGVFTGRVEVIDDDGGSGSAQFVVQVEDDDLHRAVVQVPGEPGTNATLTFDWRVREAGYNNELGIFVVDNILGKVGSKLPGDSGYWKAALDRAQIIFASGQTVGASKQVTLPADTLFSSYLVKNSTTAQAKTQSAGTLPTNPNVWFPFKNVNSDGFQHYVRTDLVDSRIQYEVEDLTDGGDKDFDDMVYTISLQAPAYAGQTKFFVADKGTDQVLRYDQGGAYVGTAAMKTDDSGNTDARGIASNADGSKLWVIDSDKKVYVYSPPGNFKGSWTPNNLNAPQGITTDGTDIWIVNSGDDKVRRYKDAASRTSGSQNPNNTYSLNSANADPSDIVTRNGLFWVTDEHDDEVYVYDIVNSAFHLLGHWKLDGKDADASGLTLDPTGGTTDLWILDRVDKQVYRYADGQARRSGSQSAIDIFNLAVANTQAEGIADPPNAFVSLLGEQDYPDGSGLNSNSVWLAAQSNEPFPFNTLHAAPKTFQWKHSGLPFAGPATLTFSLWDLDNTFAGVQLTSFKLNGIAQPVDVFEIPVDNEIIKFYSFPIDASLLAGLSLTVELTISSPPEGNEVGIDFSRLVVSPLPPKVTVQSPPIDAVLAAGTTILVKGQAVVGSRGLNIKSVAINGRPVDALDSAGNFFSRVTVAPGENTFAVIATDSLGQSATTSLTFEGRTALTQQGQIDFSQFSDVTASFAGEYARTSLAVEDNLLFADLAIRNGGQFPADKPLLVGIANISNPTVRVHGPDGLTPDGLPYFDFSALVTGDTLEPGQATEARTISFFNPNSVQFTYDLVFFGRLNQAPAITSVPDVEALAGRPYRYDVDATDPDGDVLTYALTEGPAGASIDSATGLITWSPTAADVGTRTVTVRVEDGRGGSAEQQYVLSVITPPPNRPPVFTSVPVVSANAGSAYSYPAIATDPDSDALSFSVVNGPQGLTIDATTGVANWTPSADILRGNSPPIDPTLPTLAGFDVSVYSQISDPAFVPWELTFGPSGTLFVGNDNNDSPVHISRIPPGGGPGGPYGDSLIADPDAVLFDRYGSISGVPGTVLIGTGQAIWAIAPDQSTRQLFGSGGNLNNMQFDGRGRLIAASYLETQVLVSTGGPPKTLFLNPVHIQDFAVDAQNRIYTLGGDGTIRLFDENGVLLNDHFATGISGFASLMCGQGGVWGRDLYVLPATGGQLLRFDSQGQRTVVANGLHAATFAFGPDESLYLAEAANMRILRIAPNRQTLGLQSNQFPVLLAVEDGRGGVATQSFSISVNQAAGNHAPVIISEPVTTGVPRQPYAYDVDAVDADSDLLSYSLASSPTGMTIDSASGQVNWTPATLGLDFAFRTGSGGYDGGHGITTDSDGNVLVVGWFSGTVDFDPGPSTFDLTADSTAAFVAKYSSLGGFVWARRVDGNLMGIAVDRFNNVYVGGSVLAKLDANGSIAWVHSLPLQAGYGNAITVDNVGNVYSTGSFGGTVDFDPGPGVANLTSSGSGDGFVLKLNSNGAFIWARRVGGGNDDFPQGLKVDPAGNIYVTGYFSGTADFDPGPADFNLTSLGGRDAFVMKFTAGGNLLWAKRTGGSGEYDTFHALVLDAVGNVYTSGMFAGTVDFDPGPGEFNITGAGNSDIAISKLDSAGNFVWARAAGGIGGEQSEGLAVDHSGSIYVTGTFTETVDFDPGTSTFLLTNPYPSSSGFILKLTAGGDFIWAEQPAGGFDVAVDDLGSVYATGYFDGTRDFDPSSGVRNLTSAGGVDAFVAKMHQPPLSADVSVRVEDGRGGSDTQSFTIDLSNRPPKIVSTPVTTGFAGVPYSYDVNATDPDDDPLGYSLTQSPTGMTIDSSTGQIAWGVPSNDPKLGFALSIGGDAQDANDQPAVAVDLAGNVYVTGTFQNTADFDPGPGVVNLSTAGGEDAFVAKYSATGALVWARRLGGSAVFDRGHGIAVDAAGNVYTTGFFNDTADFDPGSGTFNMTSAGTDDIYVSKLDSAGNFVWARRAGGSAVDRGGTIVLDDSGSLYLTGSFAGTADFDPGPGTLNLTSAGADDGYLWKLSPAGNLVWARQFGGSLADGLGALDFDSNGNIVAAGAFAGTADVDPSPTVLNLTSAGGDDAFIVKFDSAGTLLWAKRVGGIYDDYGIGIHVDSSDSIVVDGQFQDTVDFDPDAGIKTLTSNGLSDGFVWKLDGNGKLIWAINAGGTGDDRFEGIAVDPAGSIFAVGRFSNTADFQSGPGVTNLTSAGSFDVAVAKYDDTGSLIWARGFGGTGRDEAGPVIVDPNDGIVIAGRYSASVDFDPGAGTSTLTSKGFFDNFVFTLTQPKAVPEVTVRVEDGRGGSDSQSFIVDVSTAAPATIRGSVFSDLDGNGSRNLGRLLVAEQIVDDVKRFDGKTGVFIDSFVEFASVSGGLPHSMVFGHDGNLYVALVDNTVLRFDGTSGAFLGNFIIPGSGGLAVATDLDFGPDGDLYVAKFSEDNSGTITNSSILRYDGQSGAFLSVFVPVGSGGLNGPDFMEFGPDGNLYITNVGTKQVLRYDGQNGAFLSVVVDAGGGGLGTPDGLVFGPDGSIYVSDITNNVVLRFDGQTGAFRNVAASGHGLSHPHGLIIGPDGLIYVANQFGNTVLRFYGETGSFIDSFTTGSSIDRPMMVRFTPDVEVGLGGWTVFLDENGNSQRDPSERFTRTDANGNYSFPNLPAGTYTAAEEPQAGWQQTAPPGGAFTITVAAGEIVTGKDFGNKQVAIVEQPNRPPTFTSTSPTEATVGKLLRYNAAASDPDHDVLTFDLVVKPVGMAIDPETGIVVWAPTADQTGPQDVTLRVQDGRGGIALQSFRLAVSRPNVTPVITSKPKGPAIKDLPWRYRVTAQDADGDPIAFSISGHPDMTIDAVTGLVQWTPVSVGSGSQHVEVTASDNRGATTTQFFDLPVVATAPNDPPAITSSPRFSIRIGDTYLYQVVASDPNSDPLAYSLPTKPNGMSIDVNGLVTWIPTAEQFGPNDVQVRVEDGRGGFATQTWTLNVVTQSSNKPPTITSSPSFTATVGRLYAYDLAGSDPDGDPLSWSFDTAPAGASIDPNRGTFRWTPTSDQLGSQSVVIRAVDGRGGYATQSYSITVRAVNVPPAITSTPLTTATVNQAYSYAVRADDVDGDPLAFRLTVWSGGMSIDAASGLIQWTPADNQQTTHTVTIEVSDGQGGIATQTYSLVVTATAANRPPVITSNPSQVATVGELYQYAVTASDPDGDSLTYTLPIQPAGMSIDAAGLVTWTPGDSQTGLRSVTIAVTDSAGNSGTQSFQIDVATVNHPPTITSSPVQIVTAGLPYRYDVRATDPDGDPLTYTLDQFEPGMSIDNLGRITWATGIPNIGTHRIAVTVEDPRGTFVTQTYDLAVLADTQAPRLNLYVRQNPVNIGTTVTFLVVATDNVGVASISLTLGGVAVPIDAAGRGNVTLNNAGDIEVVARATDTAGLFSTASGFLTVIDPSDTNPPDVDLTSPLDGTVISAPVDVIGTASDDTLVSYVLEAIPADGGAATVMFRGTTSVVNGVLGKFDPTGLANDSYVLRLTATDAGGNISSIESSIEVAGDLKVGNFTLSFTDLTIPVSGIPISVSRTYDSLQASRQDDFGFGWRMEFRDTDLRTSLPPTGQEEYGDYNAFRDNTRVYITTPGGRREGFTFKPVRQGGFANYFAFYKPAFIADRGVTSQLSVPDDVTLIFVNGGYYGLNDLAYNPADNLNYAGQYTLTTKDGIAYTIDAVTGDLQTIGDAHGNTLTFTDTDVTSSAGPRVTFGRDPQERITSVTDPMGHSVHYVYDLRGDLVSVTDRENNTTRFEYADAARPHFLTKVIDPLGRTGVRAEYDAQGRLITLIDAAGNPVHLSHDPNNSTETVTDALGHPTTFEYDERGNVVTEIDPEGGQVHCTYDLGNNMLTETNALGKTRTFSYDGEGNVLTETDPLGNVTRNTYRTFVPGTFASVRGARPITVLATTTDPLGNTTTNDYDGAGNLLSTTDAAGNLTRFGYDGSGNQTSIIDAANHVTGFEYDSRGNMTRQTDALGHEMLFTYDGNGNQLTQTTTLTTPGSVRTLITRTDYDENGHPIAVTDAEGHRTRTEYDDLGRQVATFDALDRPTRFNYDERGQLVETVFFDGTHTTTGYDLAGRRIVSADRAGRETRFEYDDTGRLVATIFPDDTPGNPNDNPRTRTEYDLAGQVTAQFDERGTVTTFRYDDTGRQIAIRDILGHETTTAYDTAGRTASTTDALGHTTHFNYDSLGRPISTVFADGTRTAKSYDILSRVVAETDQADRTTAFEYDPLGRLTAVVDALNQRTVYGYDEAGNLVAQTDANVHTTHYEYDGLGRRIATVLPLGQRSTSSFDPLGNLASTTDFNLNTINYEYDSNNRLIAKRFPDSTAVLFAYTPTGQRASTTDVRGTTLWTYDARDRLISRTEPDGAAIAYTYDVAGNRLSLTTTVGANVLTTGYTFDLLNRPETVTDPAGGLTHYAYDAASNLVRTDFPNGTFETRQYDSLNRLLVLENRNSAGVFAGYTYTLAPSGRRDAVVEQDGRRVDYSYDALDRLTREQITDAVAGNRTIGYVYDSVGNRLSRTDTVGGTTGYTYDANDRLLIETTGTATTAYSYDANGNTTHKLTGQFDQAQYVWDFENRLKSADVVDGAGSRHMDYRYDADDLRVSSSVSAQETRFLLDTVQRFGQVNLGYTPAGVVLVSYVHGHDLISQTRSGTKSIYHVDGLGSTRALTNAAGNVTDRYTYEAFGRTIAQTGSTPNVYLFAGEQRDANVGLDYLRARWLQSTSGRFLSVDSFAAESAIPRSLNRYAYAFGNPSTLTDPSGNWPTHTHEDLIDKAFGNSATPPEYQIDRIYGNGWTKHLKGVSSDQDSFFSHDGQSWLGGGQSAMFAYEHAMRRLGQTPAEAEGEFIAFLGRNQTSARFSAKDKPYFWTLLGRNLHALADSTSPTHRGFQLWEPLDLIADVAHRIGESRKPTSQEETEAILLMHSEYDRFTKGPGFRSGRTGTVEPSLVNSIAAFLQDLEAIQRIIREVLFVEAATGFFF